MASQMGNTQSQMGNTKSQMGNTKSQMGNTKSQMGNTKSQMGNTKINYTISTITISVHTDLKLNILELSKFLKTDDKLIGIKCNIGETPVLHGEYYTNVNKKSKNIHKTNKKLFYNQITIIVKTSLGNVNVKLFSNGCLHLTGIKNIEYHAYQVFDIIYNKIVELHQQEHPILLTHDIDHPYFYLDNTNVVYTCKKDESQTYNMLCYKKSNGHYSISKKEYEFDYPFFKSIEQQCSKRILIDLYGNEVGYSKVQLLKNKKLYNNKNVWYDDDYIYTIHNNEIILIGYVNYIFHNENCTIKDYEYNMNNLDQVKITHYVSNPILNNNEIRMLKLDVNCINISFKLEYMLNTQRLYDLLLGQNYMCYYKPMEYRGLKFIYKFPRHETTKNDGRCHCNKKCTCYNLTFIIFQNGSVIASGFKNMIHIDISLDTFYTIIVSFKHIIQKKELFN